MAPATPRDPPGTQQATLPRQDGLYVARPDVGSSSSYLRFLDDRRLVEATSTGTPDEVARWLTDGKPELSYGTYAVRGHSISFITLSPYGRVRYWGHISDDGTCITLAWHSTINRHRGRMVFHFTHLPLLPRTPPPADPDEV
jgi:hypothetical protein